MLDSSIMGMGKGAGNLNTELLLEHINIMSYTKYNISPLLEIIDTVLRLNYKDPFLKDAINKTASEYEDISSRKRQESDPQHSSGLEIKCFGKSKESRLN